MPNKGFTQGNQPNNVLRVIPAITTRYLEASTPMLKLLRVHFYPQLIGKIF
jgi:hypothetical protein